MPYKFTISSIKYNNDILGTVDKKLINSFLKITVPVGLFGLAKIILVFFVILFKMLLQLIVNFSVFAVTTFAPDILAIIG